MQHKRMVLAIAAMLMVLAVVLSAGVAYARYMDTTNGRMLFRVKALQDLEMEQQQWQQVNDTYVFTFTMKNPAENCVMFLAMSEGISAPEQVQVFLSLPGNGGYLQATGEAISPESDLYSAFGGGYVFRFVDGETGEERTLDLQAQEYALSVVGLGSAAEELSLLRVFIEYAE